jgi:flagellar biosynthesis chaperone FliJ
MSDRRPVKRLLALRVIEEEREETELRRQRQLRQICLDALNASETRQALALRALHTALDSGDRGAAISAEMALACGPMERHMLQRHLAQLDARVEVATAAWHGSRIRRLQMETIVETAETNLRRERQAREQKRLDGWFLSSRPQRLSALTYENSQRETQYLTKQNGALRADSVHE